MQLKMTKLYKLEALESL